MTGPERINKSADELEELKAIFCLPALLVNYAVDLSQKKDLPLRAAFRYADNLHDFGGDYTEEPDPDEPDGLTPEERLREWADDEFYQYMFFERGVSIDLTTSIEIFHGIDREKIRHADPAMLRFYEMCSTRFDHFARAWEYYKAHAPDYYTEEELEEYIEKIDSNIPMEIALATVMPPVPNSEGIAEDMAFEAEMAEIEDNEFYDAFEDWARQETDWNGENIAKESDPDNLAYEDDDSGPLDF